MKTGTRCVCVRRNLAMQYKVTFLQLTALVGAYKHFPSIVPKRWHLVSQFVAKYSENFFEHSPIYQVGVDTTKLTFARPL